jgi:transposase InsO family protein
MLSPEKFVAWSLRLGLSDETRLSVEQIRGGNPARRVGGGRHNVTGRYPSKKMGVTIQFESHRVELPAIYELEHDGDVIEYFDQAPAIKLDYRSADGKRLGVFHTPDFFVIRQNSVGWEECKAEEDLLRLSQRNPNRYCYRDNQWQCPPGIEYGRKMGFYYRVRTSKDIDWAFQRNVQFLEDYWRSERPSSLDRERVLAAVAASPGLTLQDLFDLLEETVSRDEIYFSLATEDIYADLSAAPLSEPRKVKLFSDRQTATASLPSRPFVSGALPVTLSVGVMLIWRGTPSRIVNIGEEVVCVLSENQTLVEIPIGAIQEAVAQGSIIVAAAETSCKPTQDRLSKASQNDLKVANERWHIVVRRLHGEQDLPVAERTLRRWIASYQNAEVELGCGYLGLLPTLRTGNRTAKLPEATRKLMAEFIENDYETLKQKTRQTSWRSLCLACERVQIIAPSFKTFCVAVRQRSGFEQSSKRQGHRAAYQRESFFWDLEQRTPRHGDRPFEIVHIDHTQMNVWAICPQTNRLLGRPWLTLMTDAFSRRILSFYVTFDPPSYRSCMMLLRECVRRHSRFPQTVVVDGGKEFQSVYFEALLARYECTKKCRPPAKARFGATCERIFGTTNKQFIHNLQGNTQIYRQTRQVTKSVNPQNHAVWPLKELQERLSEYAYEVYDTIEHPALGQTPRAAFTSGLNNTGLRLQRIVPFDREFLIFTLPTTRKGTAQVSSARGVKIHHIYYWCEAFRDPSVENTAVDVRFDPFDAGTAYAFVKNLWVECHSEYYTVFRGRSEREVQLATTELRKRGSNHSAQSMVTAKKLAEFLESVERQEDLLRERVAGQNTRTSTLAAEDHTPNVAPMVNPPSTVDAAFEDAALVAYEEM